MGARVTIFDKDFYLFAPLRRFTRNVSGNGVAALMRIAENVVGGAGAFIGKGVNMVAVAVVSAGSLDVNDLCYLHSVTGNPNSVIKPLEG